MKNSKRSFKQFLRDLFEDEVFAFAMAYAGAKSDYSTVRALEDKLR